MNFLLTDMRVFTIKVVVTRLDVLNVHLPRVLVFYSGAEVIGFLAPPGCFGLKLFDLHRLGFVVSFYTGRVRMLVKPDVLSRRVFAEKQQIGFDAGIRCKHAIGQAHDGVQVAVFQQFFFDAGFNAFAKQKAIG